jgi:ATP-dependent helicase/nuclease subunit B
MHSTLRTTTADAATLPEWWAGVAASVSRWAAEHTLALREVVVLLPFAQLMAPARSAFAQAGVWMPRIETTRTLSATLPQVSSPEPGELTGEAAVDALVALRMLRAQPWSRAWLQRDPRSLESAAADVASLAKAFAQTLAAVAPGQRAARCDTVRALLTPLDGPGAAERRLARLAFEWAALAPAPPTDALWALRPAGWVTVQAGGVDPLPQALLAAAAVPTLVVDTDPAEPLAALGRRFASGIGVRAGFEDEAQAAATHIVATLRTGVAPIALIAQDRLLVRRIRALLEREAVVVADETGWTLSTTRAAARVMALVDASAAEATTDALLDWLKAGEGWPGLADAEFESGLAALETACRHHGWSRRRAIAAPVLPAAAAALWSAASALLDALERTRTAEAGAWMSALQRALQGCGAFDALQRDDAGAQVLRVLRLQGPGLPTVQWAALQGIVLDWLQWRGWLNRLFEQADYVPAPPARGEAHVFVTPMARAMLRPFAALVCPGADARLGAWPDPTVLLGDQIAVALGLPDRSARHQAQAQAFAQLALRPAVTFFRRRHDGKDPLPPSPWIEALEGAAPGLWAWPDPRERQVIAAQPVARPAPQATALPAIERLSASACEALRECPYRFFALHRLGLREDDELDDTVEKRDFGTWLHAVLFAFHAEPGASGGAAAETARLLALGLRVQRDMGLDDAMFLPFAAAFDAFAPRYVLWQAQRSAAGVQWQAGEREVEIAPALLDGVRLHGVIDRIDEHARPEGVALEIIDYKAGSVQALKQRLRNRFEDTQLAFYAALGMHAEARPITACYLPLDGSDALQPLVHEDVASSAQALLQGLGDELRRIQRGAALPALGEEPACTYCAARGLCRRDHWELGA